MTLPQFREVIAPSKEKRERIEDLEDQLTQAIAQREAADDSSLSKIQLMVNGVLADQTEGPTAPCTRPWATHARAIANQA